MVIREAAVSVTRPLNDGCITRSAASRRSARLSPPARFRLATAAGGACEEIWSPPTPVGKLDAKSGRGAVLTLSRACRGWPRNGSPPVVQAIEEDEPCWHPCWEWCCPLRGRWRDRCWEACWEDCWEAWYWVCCSCVVVLLARSVPSTARDIHSADLESPYSSKSPEGMCGSEQCQERRRWRYSRQQREMSKAAEAERARRTGTSHPIQPPAPAPTRPLPNPYPTLPLAHRKCGRRAPVWDLHSQRRAAERKRWGQPTN